MNSSRKRWLSWSSSVPQSSRLKRFPKRLAYLINQCRIETEILISPTRTEINVENVNEAQLSSGSDQNVEWSVAEIQINDDFVINSSRNTSNNNSINRSLIFF